MKKDLQFEAFEDVRSRRDKDPAITILKKGSIGFGSGFVKKFIHHRPKYVALRFAQDETHIYLGFNFFDESGRAGALKMFYPKNFYGIIGCISFFNNYNLDLNKIVGKYNVEEFNDSTFGKMYVIKIKK